MFAPVLATARLSFGCFTPTHQIPHVLLFLRMQLRKAIASVLAHHMVKFWMVLRSSIRFRICCSSYVCSCARPCSPPCWRTASETSKSGVFYSCIEGLALTLSVRLQLRKAMFASVLAHHIAKCGMFLRSSIWFLMCCSSYLCSCARPCLPLKHMIPHVLLSLLL